MRPSALWLLSLVAIACGGQVDINSGGDVPKNRPSNMPPGSWLTAAEGGVNAGRSDTLSAAGLAFSNPPQYPADSRKLIVRVLTDDPGDARTLGVTAQVLQTSANPNLVDVALFATWGVQGGLNQAWMKIGNGVVFNVPATFLNVQAQNLLGACQVSVSASPDGLPNGSVAAPHWAFTVPFPAGSNSFMQVQRYLDLYAPGAGALSGIVSNLVPNNMAPWIIPPFAVSYSLSLHGPANATYFVRQMGVTGTATTLRTDQVTTDANGYGAIEDIPLLAEAFMLQVNETTIGGPIVEQVDASFDFKLGL